MRENAFLLFLAPGSRDTSQTYQSPELSLMAPVTPCHGFNVEETSIRHRVEEPSVTKVAPPLKMAPWAQGDRKPPPGHPTHEAIAHDPAEPLEGVTVSVGEVELRQLRVADQRAQGGLG